MKFVLLQHDTRPTPCAQRVSGDTHYDLMIDHDGSGLLWTWRLVASPLEHDGPIAAERIADHRREYLNYEGEVGGNRGRVQRCDSGDCKCSVAQDRAIILHLRGRILVGEFQIVGSWFSRVKPADAPSCDQRAAE